MHFYGAHAVLALLRKRSWDVACVFVQTPPTPSADEAIKVADALGIGVQKTGKDKLTELCQSAQHQGLVALAKPAPIGDEGRLLELACADRALFLVLDQITDAHNLGACLRTAAAMGVDAVVAPKNHAASITPTVAKVAVGACEAVEFIEVTNLARALKAVQDRGVFVFGATLDAQAKSAFACDFGKKAAIVVGSEGFGLRKLTQDRCDTLVYIPMADTPDRPQSLNVSVATGMLLYEAARQRAVLSSEVG